MHDVRKRQLSVVIRVSPNFHAALTERAATESDLPDKFQLEAAAQGSSGQQLVSEERDDDQQAEVRFHGRVRVVNDRVAGIRPERENCASSAPLQFRARSASLWCL